jgi:hypothetical protein
MEDEAKLKAFNEEHDKQYSSPPLDLTQPQGTPGQAPNIEGLSPEDAATYMKLKAQMEAGNPSVNVNTPNTAPVTSSGPAPAPVSTPPAPAYVPAPVQTVGSNCSECGMMHPPLPMGEKCPNAKTNIASINDQEIGNFLASWRNIIISQIEQKGIQDAKKLFQQATVMLAQFLEEYKEEANVETNPTGETQG